MRRILVLRGGALGDFIVTLPALALLRRRWPGARIELAGNATAAVLALDAGLLTAAYSQNESRWSALYSSAPLPADFAAWLATFDLVLNFWPDADGALGAHFPARPDQRFLSSGAHPAQPPAAKHYCDALHPLGMDASEYWFRLAPAPRLPRGPRHRVAIHPGSGSRRKNWPLERWCTVCDWLTREKHADLLVVTGEAETAESQRLGRFGQPAHALPLRELARQLSGCDLFLGHDSGVSHLAAACGVQSILLFGPTDPAMWAPPAPHVSVIKCGDTLDAITMADVQRSTSAALADLGAPPEARQL